MDVSGGVGALDGIVTSDGTGASCSVVGAGA